LFRWLALFGKGFAVKILEGLVIFGIRKCLAAIRAALSVSEIFHTARRAFHSWWRATLQVVRRLSCTLGGPASAFIFAQGPLRREMPCSASVSGVRPEWKMNISYITSTLPRAHILPEYRYLALLPRSYPGLRLVRDRRRGRQRRAGS